MTSNYIPATPELIEEQRTLPTVASVWAVWLGNLGAGIGVGVIAAIVGNRLLSLGWQDTLLWFAVAGGLAFGVLMAARFSLDEIVDAWEWRRMVADLGALQTENATLRARLDSLQRDLDYERLQRRAAANVPAGARVDAIPASDNPATRDARILLDRHFGGKLWGRDPVMADLGWSRNRWELAKDVLVLAGIISTEGRKPVVVISSIADAHARLNGMEVG